MDDLDICIADLADPRMVALLERHGRGMLEASPPGTCHVFELDQLKAAPVTVWSATLHGELAGCGAIAELEPLHGELKSMRTHDAHLGKGVGRALLRHILGVARQRGYSRVSLETGAGERFAAANHLYTSHGFVECQPFGDYVATAWNRYLTLSLTRASG